MKNEGLTLDEVRRMAAEIGMTRLADEYPQQLLRATNTARARRKALTLGEITTSEEPAHVFHLAAEDKR